MKKKIAFVKHGGLTIGGSELWIQKIAANLPKDRFDIDFFYCDDTEYIGGPHVVSPSRPERIEYLISNGVNVIRFNGGKKNIKTLTHEWVGSDFFEVFDESKYDLIQTVKAGPKEYPFYKLSKPVVEIVALANRPDTSKNIAWSFHSSGWQRAQWVRLGGSIEKSSVLTAPVEQPQSSTNYRSELGIPANAIVAGFHQRRDNSIASPIPLLAFKKIQESYPKESAAWHFIIKNGGDFYRTQARELGLKNIHFLEPTPDSASVSTFLNTLDIFAHGRKDGETFGAVFVEAMIHGLPCLSHWSEEGANAQPETMGPAGMFAMNLDEYTRDLHRLYSDNTFRKHLASKAKPHTDTYYSMEKCIAELIEVYDKVTKNSLSPSTSEDPHVSTPTPYGYSDMGFLYAGDMNKSYNIAYHVLVGGIPEAFDVALVRSLLPFTKNFYDIGANTGIYCWIASQYYAKNMTKNAHVEIFEPQTDCIPSLTVTRSLNNWEAISTIHPIGLGSRTEEKTLHLSGTGSTVAQEFVGVDVPTQTIHIDTLDNFCNQHPDRMPDFIKIDVEGFEHDVLIGGTNTISKQKPIIFIEIADQIKSRTYTNNMFSKTLDWLFDQGYSIWECTNNHMKPIERGFKNGSIAMYLCMQKGSHDKAIQQATSAVANYHSTNLFFGIEKRRIKKAWHKIVPPYITFGKLARYLARLVK